MVIHKIVWFLIFVATFHAGAIAAGELSEYHQERAIEEVYRDSEKEAIALEKTFSSMLIKHGKIIVTHNAKALLDKNLITEKKFSQIDAQIISITQGSQCSMVVIHPSDSVLHQNLKLMASVETLNGFLSEEDKYWFSFYHEFAHCIQNLYFKGDHRKISYQMFKETGLSGGTANLASELVNESLSDVFAILKIQQRYLTTYNALIEAGQMPVLSPTATMVVFMRMFMDNIDETHTTHNSSEIVALALNVALKQPYFLINADDKDIFRLSFRCIEEELGYIARKTGLLGKETKSVQYPDGYLEWSNTSLLERYFLVSKNDLVNHDHSVNDARISTEADLIIFINNDFNMALEFIRGKLMAIKNKINKEEGKSDKNQIIEKALSDLQGIKKITSSIEIN